MEKLMTKTVLNKMGFLRAAFIASVGVAATELIFASNMFAQLPAPAVPTAPGAPAPTAEVERVVVTGSNIPTAEETGPNPVDTYRPQDIEKLVSVTRKTCKLLYRRRRAGLSTRTSATVVTALSSSTCAVYWPRKRWC
jgi:hypothetical protein